MKTCPACSLIYPDEATFCFVTGDTLEAQEDGLVGTSVAGRYRLNELIAVTPWSRRYRGNVNLVEQACTVKLVSTSMAATEAAQAVAEAAALARRCRHTHVLPVLGFGLSADGRMYVAHPLFGEPAATRTAKGPLQVSDAILVVRQVLIGLMRIHDFGAVHGSIHAHNVLIAPKGWLTCLADTGLGRVLARDPWDPDPRALPYQQYIAPELNSQRKATPQADLYATGALMVQLATGSLPYDADDANDLRGVLAENQDDQLLASIQSLPAPLQLWVRAMMSVSVSRRPENAHLALADLERVVRECQLPLGPVPEPPVSSGALTLSGAFEQWNAVEEVFSEMLTVAFPDGAGVSENDLLQTVRGKVKDLNANGKQAEFQHRALKTVQARAAEGREQVASKMVALNEEAQSTRQELRQLRARVAELATATSAHIPNVRSTHDEVLRWEGRSAFVEPYPQLADAYRAIATEVEDWVASRKEQQTAQDVVDGQEARVQETELELAELRETLQVHESNLVAEFDATGSALATLGTACDELQAELTDLAMRFSAPLRSKPELGPTFRKLASAVARSEADPSSVGLTK